MKTDLKLILSQIFPDNWTFILSLAYFQALEGEPLSKVERWSKTHRHPYDSFIDNRRVSELLPSIGEEKQLEFFKMWAEKRLEEEYLAYDITSVSSYSELNDMTRFGYNRDGESLPQINIAMLFGEKTRLLVYFKCLPGSIRDVSTLQNFLTTVVFLHMGKLRLVMDKGFYSRKKVNDLFDKRMKFTIALPFSSTFAKEQVERVRNTITDHHNFIQMNDQNLFCISSLNKWEEKKRIYVHVYYNASTAAADYEIFLNKLRLWENELKNGQFIEDNQKYYAKYFLIQNTPKSGGPVSYNQSAIEAYKKNTAGYLVLISNDIKDPIEALTIYRAKDVVEKAFDNLKNSLDMKRLRVHLQENMKGRLFIQFISLILVSYIHKVMSDEDLFKFGSMSCLLKELKLLNTVSTTGTKKLIFSEQTKRQREIFEAFGINPKTYV